jgi:hypothetical protein
VLAQPVWITRTSLTRLLRLHGFDVPHPVIQERQPISADDGTADEALWAECRELDFVDSHGRLTGGVVDTLAVLARASVEYFAWFTENNGPVIGVLVAGLGEEAVIVVGGIQRVRLTGTRNVGLAETLVRLLASVPPARIDAVNLRLAAVPGAADSAGALVDARPHVEKDHTTVRALVAQPAVGFGELYVAVRDQDGIRVATDEPIRYRDTRTGRVLIHSGDGYLSVAPATEKLLVERLRGTQLELVR